MARKRHVAEPEPEEITEDLDEEEGEAEVVAAPDPRDEAIKALRSDLDKEREERLRLEGRMSAPRTEPPPRIEAEETLDDAELDEAIAQGGAKARAVIGKAARIEAKKIAKTYEAAIEDMRTKVDGFGMPALARHEAQLTSVGLTFYKDYEKEINERLAQLPLQTRTQPEAIQQIYALVVGGHLDEIVERRVEEAVKKANGSPGGGPTNVRGRSQGDTRVPSAQELWGPDEAALIASKGGEDNYARKNGFTDWGTMLRETGVLEPKGSA